MGGVVELENVMKNSVENPDDCVFLHPGERHNCVAEDLDALTRRNFEIKVFMRATLCVGDTFFLRKHHMNNLKYTNRFRYIWDYINAAHATKVQTCANTTLTTFLTTCFYLSLSDYCPFSISLASGLLKYVENIMFKINDAMVKNRKEVDTVCG